MLVGSGTWALSVQKRDHLRRMWQHLFPDICIRVLHAQVMEYANGMDRVTEGLWYNEKRQTVHLTQ